MSGRSYRVKVVTSEADWLAWHEAVDTRPGENLHDARVRVIAELDETVMHVQGESFYWMCPGCGGVAGGTFGNEAVSGWDQPRWVNTGTPDRPTLTPSLGCPTWWRGLREGHWFLRDGLLVPA